MQTQQPQLPPGFPNFAGAAPPAAAGELPVDVCSVWITDDAQFARADELLRAFLTGSLARRFSGEAWTCACGEKLEGQFTACWRCG